MMIVHQLLHGYRKGHQLLSSSIQLDAHSIELATRLSDLSGSLTIDAEVQPYLTCYPLPNQQFYAIAKTWLDDKASRAGCVLTQTLLIPIEIWMSYANPIIFKNFFIKPEDSNDTERYHEPLEINSEDFHPVYPPLKFDQDMTIEFIYRFFGEGINPIVWFTEEDAEDLFWILVRSLWPRLRREFACCTFSLQQRFLEEKPFNLLFAPFSTYTRFQQIPRENIIDRSNIIFSSPQARIREEPWVKQWATYITGSPYSHINILDHTNDDFSQLGNFLGDDPTEVKRIYLIKELRKRSIESPLAAVGLLDIVESLAKDESAAVIYKEYSLRVALLSINTKNDLNEILKSLFLISDRITHNAYRKVNHGITSELHGLIAKYVSIEISSAFKTAECLFNSPSDFYNSPYIKGLVVGLLSLGKKQPTCINILQQYPDTAPLFISLEPKLALLFLQSDNLIGYEHNYLEDLVSWISSITDSESLDRIRKEILPKIRNDSHKILAKELLRSVNNEDVYSTLETLSISTNGFKAQAIREIVCEKISKIYPSSTRNWATKTELWSDEAAVLLAATYPEGIDGIAEIIKAKDYSDLRKSQILGAYISAISENHSLPQWFKDFAKTNQELLTALFPINEVVPDHVSQVITKVLDNVWELPIIRSFQLQEINKIIASNNYSFSSGLAASSIRCAIIHFIRGEIDWETYYTWESTNWAGTWMSSVDIRDLELIFKRICSENTDTWTSGWRWLAHASDNLYQNSSPIVPKLIENLLSNLKKKDWRAEITTLWVSILQRIKSGSNRASYMQACSDALYFAFQSPFYPVSSVVVEAFFPVYSAVVDSGKIPPETDNLFGYYDWDKGKQLRRKIIDAFLNSNWPPGDLALSVKEKSLLRKIYSRLRRHWGGKEYIQLISNDLNSRYNDPSIANLSEELNSLIRQRNFYEAWD